MLEKSNLRRVVVCGPSASGNSTLKTGAMTSRLRGFYVDFARATAV